MLKKIVYSTLLFLSIFITVPQEWLSYFKNEQEKINFLKNESTTVNAPSNSGRMAYNFNNINPYGGGAEMNQVFAIRSTTFVSSILTELNVGVFPNPYLETLPRVTFLPSENLWSRYVMMGQSGDNDNEIS